MHLSFLCCNRAFASGEEGHGSPVPSVHQFDKVDGHLQKPEDLRLSRAVQEAEKILQLLVFFTSVVPSALRHWLLQCATTCRFGPAITHTKRASLPRFPGTSCKYCYSDPAESLKGTRLLVLQLVVLQLENYQNADGSAAVPALPWYRGYLPRIVSL